MNEIFIGRKSEIKKLKNNVFDLNAGTGKGKCYSVIGPNGIGKTFLVRYLEKEFSNTKSENVYCFFTSIQEPPEKVDIDPFWYFWINMIREFSTKIRWGEEYSKDSAIREDVEDVQKIYEFFCNKENINNIHDPGVTMDALEYLNNIFGYYSALGIRIIIVIDEFDRAKEVFKDGAFFQRLFELSPKARSAFNAIDLSILLLCRRSVGTIAHGMKKGSNLEDAYPAITLRGFTDYDMEEYYSLYGEQLDKEGRESIEYFCGRSPALLMGVYEAIQELDGEVTSKKLNKTIKSVIKTPYDHMCNLLKTEYVDLEKEQNCMGKFIQSFIGPAYDSNLSLYMEKLYLYGYITQNDSSDGYSSIVKKFDAEWNSEYDPIAPYFTEYVRRIVVPEDLTELEKNMWYIEDEVRKILRSVLQNRYGDAWKEHIDDYVGEGKKDYYLEPLKRMAEAMNAEERGFVYSKLDVLNFMEYHRIIREEWAETSQYFSSYNSARELKDDFYILKEVRNSYAHRTQKVFDRRYIEDASKICNRIILDFGKVSVETEETEE